MSGLIRLSTLPDELSQGYSGRLARTNGFGSIMAFEQHLSSNLGCVQTKFELPVSKVERLAETAGMSVHAYVRSHSMLTLWQGVTCASSERNLERDFYQALLTYGVRASRSALHYCPSCAQADVLFHGMSYWRREHQIPGVYGCAKHAQPLSYTDWSNVAQAPRSLGEGQQASPVLFEVAVNCPAVLRSLELAHGLMQDGDKLHVDYVYAALRPHLVAIGIDQYSYVSAKSRLCELILDSFPRQWLKASFADENFSCREQLFEPLLDCLVPLERPSSFWVLVLATAAVTTSADEALGLWLGHRVSPRDPVASNVFDIDADAVAGLTKSVEAFCFGRTLGVQQAIKDAHGDRVLELLRTLAGQWLKQNRNASQVNC